MVTQKEALFFERDKPHKHGAKEEDAPGQSVSQSRRLPTALVFFFDGTLRDPTRA